MQTREFLIIVMWAGQLASEGLNWLLKQVIREDRPIGARSRHKGKQDWLTRFQIVLGPAMVSLHRIASIWDTFPPFLYAISISDMNSRPRDTLF